MHHKALTMIGAIKFAVPASALLFFLFSRWLVPEFLANTATSPLQDLIISSVATEYNPEDRDPRCIPQNLEESRSCSEKLKCRKVGHRFATISLLTMERLTRVIMARIGIGSCTSVPGASGAPTLDLI